MVLILIFALNIILCGMDNIGENRSAREEGRRVWTALAGQAEELSGFFGAMISAAVKFLARRGLGLLLWGTLFGLLGAVYGYAKNRVIMAEMTVSYAQLEKKIYADMLFKLDQLRASGDYAALSRILGIPENQVRMIAKIDSRNIHGEPLVKDVSTQKVPFYIVAGVTDETVLPLLQEALVKYISEPPYVKDRLKLNEQNYRNEIDLAEKQLAYLDTLKARMVAGVKEPGAGDVTGLNNLHKSQADLFARIRDLRGALQFNQNIEVMDGFVGHREPMRKPVLRYLLLGFLAGIALRIGWIAIR